MTQITKHTRHSDAPVESHKNQYYSHGKLLITGEYFVLHGAKALAIPLVYGQLLMVTHTNEPTLTWESNYNGKTWFEATFDSNLQIVSTTDTKRATILVDILKASLHLSNNSTPQRLMGVKTTHNLEFDPNWGWGSSSTLINNLAQWLKVNPFELSRKTLGGSNYDVACANAQTPIYYRLKNDNPIVEQAPFNPVFSDKLVFVYLGKKQDSRRAVSSIINKEVPSTQSIETISQLSADMANCNHFDEFKKLIIKHETLVSQYIGQTPVKEAMFSDFDGEIKSCGAWGGDFVLAAGNASTEEMLNYFKTKGHSVLFSFGKIILNKE